MGCMSRSVSMCMWGNSCSLVASLVNQFPSWQRSLQGLASRWVTSSSSTYPGDSAPSEKVYREDCVISAEWISILDCCVIICIPVGDLITMLVSSTMDRINGY